MSSIRILAADRSHPLYIIRHGRMGHRVAPLHLTLIGPIQGHTEFKGLYLIMELGSTMHTVKHDAISHNGARFNHAYC